MPRPTTRHSNPRTSAAMSHSFSTTSSAAADDFGGLSLSSSAHASGSSPLSSSRHTSASPSPTPQPVSNTNGPFPTRSRGSSTSSSQSGPTLKRKERQTRLQEHLRTVKPGSSSSNGSKPPARSTFGSKSASKSVPRKMLEQPSTNPVQESPSSRPKRKAAQKVVMHELEIDSDLDVEDQDQAMEEDEDEVSVVSDEEEEEKKLPAPRRSRGRKAPRAAKVPREREISSLSTVSAGIDVEGMDDDEVQNRLDKEKNELMERLAQHGINPQADVLDRALLALSNSNEKLTVDSFLRALSSLNRSPNSTRLPLPVPPPALTVQVPNSNQSKRVSFSTLESPSTPSSSHSMIFPSPPTKSVALPVSTPLAQTALLPAFASNGSISPTSVAPPSSTTSGAIPSSSSTSSLFGNSVPAMGRIALTRRHTYLGVPSSSDPIPSLLPAFEPLRPNPFASTTSSPPKPTTSVSKLQSWLDDDDSEEEESLVKPSGGTENKPGKTSSSPAKKQEDEDSEMEIRVGGKTVKVLRKRHLEENDDDEVDAATTSSAPQLSPQGKGKQRAVECLCGETVATEESSHGTVSCSLCETSFHLACLNVNSRRHLPLEWTCERCATGPASQGEPEEAEEENDVMETPQKRPRTSGPEMTPPMSNEPTFVTTTFSPVPRGNFSACLDVALAPSPTSSPKRQFAAVPTSPTMSTSKVAIPATPHFGKDSDPRSDYSPCSPLFSRKSRSRLVSGVFDSAPFANDWAAGEHAGGVGGSLFDSHHAFGDSLNHPDWHDVTMTPSRGLGQSSNGNGAGGSGTVGGWDTPFASRSRQTSTLHPQTLPHHRTPSQDIFSGSALDYVNGGRHTAPAQMFAQRLFGEDPSAFSPSRNNNNATTGSSPISSKRAYRHVRNPSSHYILPPHAFSSPSSSSTSIFSQYPPTPHSASSGSNYLKPTHHNSLFPPSPSRTSSGGSSVGASSSAMKTSMSAPGMIRTGSNGLGIGYEEDERNDHFDDLLL